MRSPLPSSPHSTHHSVLEPGAARSSLSYAEGPVSSAGQTSSAADDVVVSGSASMPTLQGQAAAEAADRPPAPPTSLPPGAAGDDDDDDDGNHGDDPIYESARAASSPTPAAVRLNRVCPWAEALCVCGACVCFT